MCVFSLDPSPFAVSTKTWCRPSSSAPGCLVGWKERLEEDRHGQSEYNTQFLPHIHMGLDLSQYFPVLFDRH